MSCELLLKALLEIQQAGEVSGDTEVQNLRI